MLTVYPSAPRMVINTGTKPKAARMNVTPDTTVPQLVTLPDTRTAILVASLEQVSDPVGEPGTYHTANDQATLAAIKEGWDILVDTHPAEREDGSTVYVTVFTR